MEGLLTVFLFHFREYCLLKLAKGARWILEPMLRLEQERTSSGCRPRGIRPFPSVYQ